MKRRKKVAQGSDRSLAKPASSMILIIVVPFAAAVLIFVVTRQKASNPTRYVPRPAGELTFTKDIAPIVFTHCSGCHRPGQAAPFSLLTFADVKKRVTDF